MISAKNMETLRKVATRLRELKPYLAKIEREIEEERILLPERYWRQEVDDEMCVAGGALDFAVASIDDAINHIAEITGEDDPPRTGRRPPPLPDKLPTYEEVDAQRRLEAEALRKRRA